MKLVVVDVVVVVVAAADDDGGGDDDDGVGVVDADVVGIQYQALQFRYLESMSVLSLLLLMLDDAAHG